MAKDQSSAFEISSFRGGISPYEDKGIPGSFKFGKNLDIRKRRDTLSAGQALVGEGVVLESVSPSVSPSASVSPSQSESQSVSPSVSPSISVSPSHLSASASTSPSASRSPSASTSRSPSVSVSPSVSPSYSPSSGTTSVFADIIHFFVKCSDGNTYGFGNTGKVYKRTSEGVWSRVYDAGQRIRGAIEKPSSSGNTYLLFATSRDLHIKEIPGNSAWNDVDQGLSGWPKTNLTATEWHTMGLVGGDALIGNGSTLAFVGYDDSYTNEALDLIPGNVVKTIVERNGRAVIGTYKSADPTKGINGAVDTEVPLMQVGDEGDIYFANFTDSITAKRLPGGGKVNPGGMANQVDQVDLFDWESTALSWIDKQSVGNMALLGVWDADSGYNGVYTLGRKDKDHPFTLNLEYALEVDEIGAVVSTGGLTLVSYRDGATFGVKVSDVNRKATAVYEGLDLKAPTKKPIDITVWRYVELLFEPLPAGCSIEFWFKKNKTGSFIQAKVANGNTNFDIDGEMKAVFTIGDDADIYEPRLVLNPSGNNTAEIVRIRSFFT